MVAIQICYRNKQYFVTTEIVITRVYCSTLSLLWYRLLRYDWLLRCLHNIPTNFLSIMILKSPVPSIYGYIDKSDITMPRFIPKWNSLSVYIDNCGLWSAKFSDLIVSIDRLRGSLKLAPNDIALYLNRPQRF